MPLTLKHQLIKFSELRYEKTPHKGKGKRYPRVWSLEKAQGGAKDSLQWMVYIMAKAIIKSYRWFNRPRTIKIKKWQIVIGAYVIFTLLPVHHGGRTIYADPIVPTPQVSLAKISTKKPILDPVPAEVAEVPLPAPVVPKPVYAAPVSIVVSGCGDNFYANFIYMHESGCSLYNPNSSSGACGLGQAYPCSKLQIACPAMDYACENAFFNNYAVARYGSWADAYSYWLANSVW